MKLKNIFIFMGIIFFVLFYWFGVRPALIRTNCSKFNDINITKEPTEGFYGGEKTVSNPYKNCLHEKGLE